jgi:hypothetical protein
MALTIYSKQTEQSTRRPHHHKITDSPDNFCEIAFSRIKNWTMKLATEYPLIVPAQSGRT